MFFAFWIFGFAVLFYWGGASAGAASYPGSSLVAFGFYYAALCEVVTAWLFFSASLFRTSPGPAFKDTHGRLRLGLRLFSWPYLFFEYMAWRRYRKRGREPLFEKVREGLYLGARPISEDVAALRAAGVNSVLDMVAELADPKGLIASPDVVYLSLPVLDGTAPSIRELNIAVRFITKSIEAGRTVLVHCTFGHGRSATAVAAALLALGEAAGPDDALAALSRLQRKIWLSREQKRLLRSYHEELKRTKR